MGTARRIRNTGLGLIAACGLFLCCAATSAAAQPSFDGACDFGGVEILIDPPFGGNYSDVTLDMTGRGECTGVLDGAPLSGRVTLDVLVAGRTGCLGSNSDLLGTGRLDFGTSVIDMDVALHVTEPGLFRFTFAGGSGTATGEGFANLTVPSDPALLLEYDVACPLSGTCEVVGLGGLCPKQRRAAFEFDLRTNGPITSKTAPPAASPVARRAPKLRALLDLPPTRRCGADRRLRVRVAAPFRSKIASVAVRARGRTRNGTGRSTITLDGPRTRSLLVRFVVRLTDGRTRTGQRRFIPCR